MRISRLQARQCRVTLYIWVQTKQLRKETRSTFHVVRAISTTFCLRMRNVKLKTLSELQIRPPTILRIFLPQCLSICRFRWPRGLRRRSAAALLLISWVRIPPRAWMSICCECCVLSGRGLCDELITQPEESYRLWCVGCV